MIGPLAGPIVTAALGVRDPLNEHGIGIAGLVLEPASRHKISSPSGHRSPASPDLGSTSDVMPG